MTRRIKFKADYSHRWPSRAMSHFRANGGPKGDGVYTVKQEVVAAAVPKYATLVEERATRPNRDKAARRGSPRRMDGRDPAEDRAGVRREQLGPDVSTGGDDGVSLVPDAGE